IGIYLVWRGFARKKIENEREDPFAVEKSSGGKVGLGIILILLGVATSALIIGIPILLYGIYMIYMALKPKLQEGANFEYQCAEKILKNAKRYVDEDISTEDALSLLREIIITLNRVNTNSESPRFIGITEARQMAVIIHHQFVSMALDKDYEEIAQDVLDAYERTKTSNQPS
ncbi:MAG: hypothetical protein ACPF9Q_02675, partial [Opitutales bacterium]